VPNETDYRKRRNQVELTDHPHIEFSPGHRNIESGEIEPFPKRVLRVEDD